jgi:hypothetical protein
MAEALLISRKDVVKFTSMNGNVDTDQFIQYVKIAQDKHIENYLGTDLIDKIKTDIVAGTLSGDYLSLVNNEVKPALLHWTMVEYLPFSNYTIANKGVFKHTSENADSVTKEEIDYLIEKERNTAQYYTERLIDYLTFNAPSKFSEYFSNTNEDVYPDQDTFSGWVI